MALELGAAVAGLGDKTEQQQAVGKPMPMVSCIQFMLSDYSSLFVISTVCLFLHFWSL